jgi:molybdate transport system substrate-binding protein
MRALALAPLAALVFSGASAHDAAQTTIPLTVFCAGAASAAVTRIAVDFERAHGVHVIVATGTVGQLRDRLAAGERADVVIVSSSALDTMARSGMILADTRTEIGATGIGVGVRAGTALPDISTPDALRDLLLRAKSIATTDPASGATSGIYFAALLQRMHIAEIIGPKEQLVTRGFSCEIVARGDADICIQNISEIVPVAGVTLAGPFPPGIANSITYGGAVLQQSDNTAVARDFLRDITAPEHRAMLHDAGFTP